MELKPLLNSKKNRLQKRNLLKRREKIESKAIVSADDMKWWKNDNQLAVLTLIHCHVAAVPFKTISDELTRCHEEVFFVFHFPLCSKIIYACILIRDSSWYLK